MATGGSVNPPTGFVLDEGVPEGFQLDQPTSPLPSGFALDQPTAPRATPPASDALGEFSSLGLPPPEERVESADDAPRSPTPTLGERGEAFLTDTLRGVQRIAKMPFVALEDLMSEDRVVQMPEETARALNIPVGPKFRQATQPQVIQEPGMIKELFGSEVQHAISESVSDNKELFDNTIKRLSAALPESVKQRRAEPIVLRNELGEIEGIDVNIDQLAGVIAESLAFGGGVLLTGAALGGGPGAFAAANSLLVSLDTMDEVKSETEEKLIAEGMSPDVARALADEAADRAVAIVAPVAAVTGRLGEGSAALAKTPMLGLRKGAFAGALSELPEEVAQAMAPELARGEPVNMDKVITAAVLAPAAGAVHGAAVGGPKGLMNQVDERRRAIQLKEAHEATLTGQLEKALIQVSGSIEEYQARLDEAAQGAYDVSEYEIANPEIGNRTTNDHIHAAVPGLRSILRTDDGLTIEEQPVRPGVVQGITSNVIRERLRRAEDTLRGLVAERQASGEPEGSQRDELVAYQIREQQANIRDFSEMLRREEEFLAPLVGMVQEWVNTYNPNMQVFITAGAAGQLDGRFALGPEVLGHAFALSQNQNVIQLNPREIARKGGQTFTEGSSSDLDILLDQLGLPGSTSDATVFSQDLQIPSNDIVEIVAHEFGHALIMDAATTAKQDENLMRALYKAWQKDINETVRNEDVSLREAIRKTSMPISQSRAFKGAGLMGSLAQDRTTWKDFAGMVSPEFLKYRLSFDEWLANQFAKHVGGDPVARGPVERFFARVSAVLERFYRRFRHQWGANDTYQDFVRLMAAQVQRDRINGALQEITHEQNMDKLSNDAVLQAHKILSSRDLNIPAITQRSYEQDLDKYGKLVEWGYTLVQLGHLNPHIEHLQNYIASVKQWWVDKSRWGDRADTRLKEWRGLGKNQAQRLSRFVLDVTQESTRLGRKLRPEELESINRRPHNQLSDGALDVFRAMQGDFDAALGALEQVLIESAGRTFQGNPQGLAREIANIRADFQGLRNRDYFPLSRFGKYTVSVFANEQQRVGDRLYNPGDTILFETYDTPGQQQKRAAQLRNQFPRQAVGLAVLDETTQTLAGMPQALIEKILADDAMQLSDDQKQVLREMSHEMSPAQSYKKHLLKRANTQGFSLDSMRGYASYFMHFSNHIARIQNQQAMRDAIQGLSDNVTDIQHQGGDATKRAQIRNHLAKHMEYIMNPGNELANLRALGFLWYLGANVKSAYVNLTQVPMVTYPYLAARKRINPGLVGARDAKAIAQIAKATKDVSLSVMEGRGLEADELMMIDTLKERGIIDESLAMDLAALAEGSTLQRVLPGAFGKTAKAQQMIRDASYYAAWLFQSAEKFNRRIAATAAYRMARDVGMDHDSAVEEAHLAVETTQFEYARWNRARFMQGKRGVIFLFWQYLQNALHFATHDPGAIRYLLVMAAAAGFTGLPFAEDILDILDAASSKIKKISGMKNPKTDSRLILREFIKEMGADPNLVLNGVASEYGLGPLHAFELVGVPVPNVDIRGSLSLGDIVPGLSLLTDTGGADTSRMMVEGAKDVLGAALTIPVVMYQAYHDPNPDTWKTIEKVLPTAMANISKAVRRNVRGGETTRSGARLVDVDGQIIEYDPGDPGQLMESIAQGMGFAPSEVNKARELDHTQREHAAYWEARRRQIMAQWDYALQLEDKEGIADARRKMFEYNETVPNPALKLSPDAIRRSLKQRQRQRVIEEKGMPRSRRDTNLFRDIEDVYDTDPAD